MTGLLALSVQQPFAWAIAYAGKTVENRSQRQGYRGLIAIHASLTLDEPGFWPRNNAGREAARALDDLGGRPNFWDARPLAEPVPARGWLGLWTVPEDIEHAVRAQTEVNTNG